MKSNKIFDFSRKGFQDIINIMTRKINECVDVANDFMPRVDDYMSKIDWDSIINSDLYQQVLDDLGKTSEQLDTIETQKATRQELDVERKRVDTFTKLAEGSTTGDAELIDGRIGENGIVFDTLGDSIRTQLKNKKTEFISLPYQLSPNGYINYRTGEVVKYSESDAYFYTDFIELITTNSNLIIKNLNCTSKNNCGLCFYDFRKDFIKGYQYNIDTDLSIEIPKDAKYIRLTAINNKYLNLLKVYQNQYELIKENTETIKENTNKVDLLINKVNLVEKFTNSYVNKNGELVTTTGFKVSEPILVKKGAIINVEVKGYKTNVAVISEYIDDNTFKPILMSEDGIFKYSTNIKNDMKIVICSSVAYEWKLYKNEISCNIIEQINLENNYDYCQIFHKIGGIGDSLMSGLISFKNPGDIENQGGHLYKYSWLSNMCKNIGAEVVHYSKGGATTKTWLRDFLNNMKSEEVLPSAYFIALGTNDKSYVDLGVASDIGGNNETFYSLYSRIVREVKEFNPHAKIFCCSLYLNKTDSVVINYCNAIKEISDLYGCYYIDFLNKCSDKYDSKYVSIGHFTTPGYVMVGKDMQTLTNEVIINNMNDFSFFGLNHQDI